MSSISTRIARLEVKANAAHSERIALDGTPFVFPEPTPEQVLDWIDAERIPEYLEAANGVDGWAWNVRGWYPDKPTVEAKIAWCHETLAWLQRAYEQGELDAETYARLTTAQDYSADHLRELKRRAEYFRPCQLMVVYPRSDGRAVSLWLLRTGPGLHDRSTIYLIGDQWRGFPDDFKPYEQPGW